MQTKTINLQVDKPLLVDLTSDHDNTKVMTSDLNVMRVVQPLEFSPKTSLGISSTYFVTFDDTKGVNVYKPVGRALPAYRMPPAPPEQMTSSAIQQLALPGAAPSILHTDVHITHSNKFPIEREVVLSSVNKNPKIPLLSDIKRKAVGKLGVAVAPDVPPKQLGGWTHHINNPEGQLGSQPGTSKEYGQQEYSEYVHSPNVMTQRNYTEMVKTKPTIPSKNFTVHGKGDAQGGSITVMVETDRNNTKDAPKNNSKSVTKTYHTLKDMISSKFKGRDNDCDRSRDSNDVGLNNVSDKHFDEIKNANGFRLQMYNRSVVMQKPQQQFGQIQDASYCEQLRQQQIQINQQIPQRSQNIMTPDSLYQIQGYTRPKSQYGDPPSHSIQQSLYTVGAEMRSQQQIERDMILQRSGLVECRRTISHPQLPLDGITQRSDEPPLNLDRTRRNSYGNVLETLQRDTVIARQQSEEKDSDDGGFRTKFKSRERASLDSRKLFLNGKNSPRPPSRGSTQNEDQGSQLSVEINKVGISYNNIISNKQLDTPTKLGEIQNKKMSGSGTSSDYDKNCGNLSSNIDSGRGSVAYSSGRLGNNDHNTSTDSRDIIQPSTSKAGTSNDSEWVDIVESELRNILEPKIANMKLSDERDDISNNSDSSCTPPLPPLSPGASDSTPRRERRYKHHSLPSNGRPEYPMEYQHRNRSPQKQKHERHSKREHSSHYKKQLFGLDTTDLTSTTTRSLDLSSLLGGQTDSDISTQDARAIRKQLQGLENMYCEVLKLLGVRKPTYQIADSRLSRRRCGSMSSLPSSSVSSRPIREKRRSTQQESRKKNDLKNISRRFERLESHVVTLARSVAQLSGEVGLQRDMHRHTRHDLDLLRADLAALRAMHRASYNAKRGGPPVSIDPKSFSNPERVKRLTKFFGDEPPLMRLFLKKLGYEKYASLLESERVGAAELPYVGEDRLRALGVPLGPRLRILKEAGAHLDSIPEGSTTLAIV